MSITTDTVVVAAPATGPGRSVQWGAVILGALGASAISMVLLTFGAGIGLSAMSAQPYAGASAKALAVISALYTAISLVAAFGGGGYVAGRMRSPTVVEIDEAEFRDGAHGFGVWALAIVVGGVLAASGAAGVVKTALQTAAVAAGAAAGTSSPASGVSMTPVDYAVDRLLAPTPTGAAAPAGARADLNAPLARTYAASVRSGTLNPDDRAYLVAVVKQQTGLSQADAEKRVDDSYAELKRSEQKLRDAADAARKAALITAFAVAATLLLACAAACVGAASGARHRRERVAVPMFGGRRFW